MGVFGLNEREGIFWEMQKEGNLYFIVFLQEIIEYFDILLTLIFVFVCLYIFILTSLSILILIPISIYCLLLLCFR